MPRSTMLCPLLFLLQRPFSPETIDKIVLDTIRSSGTPGVAVAVMRQGQPNWLKGYGVTATDKGAPVTKDTQFAVGSVTKTFTSTLVLQLVESGKVKLSDRILSHLPSLPKKWAEVTVKQLLQHTSGIPNYTEQVRFGIISHSEGSDQAVIDLVAQMDLEFKPGTRWNYSNTGYTVLGMLISKLHKKPYSKVVQSEIFDKLSMKRSIVNDTRFSAPEVAKGYDTVKGKAVLSAPVHPSWPGGAGNVVSTVDDLSRWLEAIRTHKLYSEKTLELVKQTDKVSKSYGLGWIVQKANGLELMGHNGAINGYTSAIFFETSGKWGVAVLTNSTPGDADTIASKILLTLIKA